MLARTSHYLTAEALYRPFRTRRIAKIRARKTTRKTLNIKRLLDKLASFCFFLVEGGAPVFPAPPFRIAGVSSVFVAGEDQTRTRQPLGTR